MVGKFKDSGYSEEELQAPAAKARELDREPLLEVGEHTTEEEVVTMVIFKDESLKKTLNAFFKENKEEMVSLIGNKRVIIAERRHANTASLLFNKAGFSQIRTDKREHQRCGKGRCKNCEVMTLKNKVTCNEIEVKVDMRWCCVTMGVIYVALCKWCTQWNFYFGQTENSIQVRNRGHRSAFKLTNNEYEKSALSAHIYEQHSEYFDRGLANFDFAVVKSVSSCSLDRMEDFYIWHTEADIKGLNRYKVRT